MAVTDMVTRNLTAMYVALIVGIKAYGVVSGRNFRGGFVVTASTAVVGQILIATLTWDLSRKATCAFTRDHPSPRHHRPHRYTHDPSCKGGICWNGKAVDLPESQIRYRFPC